MISSDKTLSGSELITAGVISPDTRQFIVPEFTLESGQRLHDVVVAYRIWGNLDARGDNAILVCHALTGSADIEQWWPGLFGAGRTLDPAKHFIVCSNILGGCYGTSGPLHPHPQDGEPWGSRFPLVTIRDMVHLQARLLDALGVTRIRLAVGPSLGGMQVLEWAACYPERVQSLGLVGVSGRRSAWGIAISEAQRQAIYADPDWCDGRYTADRPPHRGMAVARMMAMVTYRSWENFEQRFARDRQLQDPDVFAVESYLRHQGRKLLQRFDANSYVRLSQAMDSHDVARGRGDYFDVLRSIDIPALVVSVESDVLYPPREQRELVEHMPRAQYRVLQSPAGHDGFLIECDALDEMLLQFLRSPEGERRESA